MISLKDSKRAIDRGTFHGNLLFHVQRSGQAVCVPSDRAFCHFTALAEGAVGSLILSLGMSSSNYLYTFVSFCSKKIFLHFSWVIVSVCHDAVVKGVLNLFSI